MGFPGSSHKEVVRILNQDRNLSSNSALIMLLLLGFPDLHMYAVDDAEVETHDGNTDVCASNTTSSRYHQSVNVSNRIWKMTRNRAPQNFSIEI